MTRRRSTSLIVCAVFAACAGSCVNDETTECFCSVDPALTWWSLYSAYDGVHDYKLVASLPPADPNDDDPIDVDTVRWKLDESFVTRDTYQDLPAGLLLTTKKPGTSTINITAKRRSGAGVHSYSTLTISNADASEWQKGDERYTDGPDIIIDSIDPSVASSSSSSSQCGLSAAERERVPKSGACGSCHRADGGLSYEPTPIQVGHYSNDELIDMFAEAMKPDAQGFRSPFLQMVSMPDCVYRSFHTWQISDDVKIGLVWKLRSLEPRKRDSDAWD